ncbi:MAG: glycosyltransferase family protein [Candidatus ainarchaeum sp.]|nr:glycosyltransferase family protein [Candidatus ainarchaeum sp.]MDD5096262.1 glycosyltransferase family protein [Candidatus ainarchaeum sp.]
MTSSRLPGKVLKEISGRPMLWHVLQRLRKCKRIDKIVIATTVNGSDDAVAKLADESGVSCFRGSEEDVLERYAGAVEKFGGDIIVRVTADCPLLDPEIVDRAVGEYEKGGYGYVSNVHPSTFPDGLDVEVFSREALMAANTEARPGPEREHVTPFIVRNKGRFRQLNVANKKDLSSMRWTVDEPQDLEFVREIYRLLGKKGETHDFSMEDVLALVEGHPQLSGINSGIRRNEKYAEQAKKEGW